MRPRPGSSGGQKARIALARAVYQRPRAIILDCTLSAVDARVGRHVFDCVVRGLLRGCTCVFATHQLQYLERCDRVLVLDQGRVVACGSPADMVKSVSLAEEEGERPTQAGTLCSPSDAASIATDEGGDAMPAKPVAQPDDVDERFVGNMTLASCWRYLRQGTSLTRVLAQLLLLVACEVLYVLTQYFLARWVSATAAQQRQPFFPAVFASLAVLTTAAAVVSAISYFTMAVGNNNSLYHAMQDAVSAHAHHGRDDRALRRTCQVMNTPIRFFHANPHGRIMNRFSKDQANVDELLPYTMYEASMSLLIGVGAVVMSCVASPFIAISVPFLVIAGLLMRQFYASASKQLKQLESVTRSPVYTLLSGEARGWLALERSLARRVLAETLDGLTTIRAHGCQPQLLRRFHAAQDAHSRASFHFLAAASWFGFWLDMLAVTLLAITAFVCVGLRSSQQVWPRHACTRVAH